MYFATNKVDGLEAVQIHKFMTVENLFAWIQSIFEESGEMPKSLCVYKAECLLDGS